MPQELTYLSYIGRIPRVYLLDIETGRQEIVGDFPGMTFAPRFSPLGDEVILTLADKGNSDIYTLNLKTNITKQLTTYSGIDTSPSYSPNSKEIAFNSDRGGSPQIYVMKSNGKKITRISFGKGNSCLVAKRRLHCVYKISSRYFLRRCNDTTRKGRTNNC